MILSRRPKNYRVTSDENPVHNCVAHAAGQDDAWWWPLSGVDGVMWLDGVECEEALECFAAAYAQQGYTQCGTSELEAGFEKMAIYVDTAGTPTHAARQLPSGRWTSKLGEWEDIEHDALDALEDSGDRGLAYGKVALILKRRRE